jgi:hypothetical protein
MARSVSTPAMAIAALSAAGVETRSSIAVLAVRRASAIVL